MAYIAGDTILDSHYNGFVTSVNAIWGTGTGVRGLGQSTVLSAVSAGNTVTASQWATLLTRLKSISNHQGNNGNITIDSVTNPSATDTIEIVANLATDIATLDTSAAAGTNAAGFGTPITATSTSSGNFSNTITHTQTFTFASVDEMRYYFNSGGKIELSWGLAGGTTSVGPTDPESSPATPTPAAIFQDTKYQNWVTLASDCGTYTLFGRTSGKVGGGGAGTVTQTTTGFDGLTGTPTSIFKQLEDTGPYTANYIQVNGSVSGAVLTFTSLWKDDAAEDTDTSPSNPTPAAFDKNFYNVLDIVDGTKTSTFTATPAATTYITSTWGSPTWSQTVNTET